MPIKRRRTIKRTIMKTYENSLTASQEDYLEVILKLSSKQTVARVKDIAEQMQVNKSSVTAALKKLAVAKLINYEPYGFITLTQNGKNHAENIANKHKLFATFFIEILQCDPKEANKLACLMEHNASKHIVQQFQQYMEFIENNPQRQHKLNQEFIEYQTQ